MSGAIIFHLQYPTELMEHQADGDKMSYAQAEAVFKNIFNTHYKNLHYYASAIVKDEAIAEEIVQNVFCRIWEKQQEMPLEQTTQAYLYKAVYNESMNQIKHAKVRAGYRARLQQETPVSNSTEQTDFKALQQKTAAALNELPEQCRTIFQLSRMEQLKYREIAERLGISVKTVEAQMSKALRILREKLADFLPVLCLCIMNFKK